jgi:hypothetical protein
MLPMPRRSALPSVLTQQDRGVAQITVNWSAVMPIAFVHTDTQARDSGADSTTTHTFTGVDLGAPAADRELIVVATMVRGVATGARYIDGLSIDSVPFDRVVRASFAEDLGFARSAAIFKGNLPEGSTGDVTVTVNSSGARYCHVDVFRGSGGYVLDAIGASTGADVLMPIADGALAFAGSVAQDIAIDASLTGIDMVSQNVSAGSGTANDHRASVGFEALAAGTRAIGTVAGSSVNLVAASFVPGSPLNIALVTADTSHSAATNTRDALQSFGHTVTLVPQADLGTHAFFDNGSPNYHCVVTARLTNNDTVADGLRALLDAGMPMVLGGSHGVTGVHTGIATRMNLTGTLQDVPSNTDVRGIDITDSTHPVTEGFDTGRVVIYDAQPVRAYVASGQSFIGTKIAESDPNHGATEELPAFIAIEQGTLDLESETINARAFFNGHHGNATLTALGTALLNRQCQWAAGNI